jgi:hypothetical protein
MESFIKFFLKKLVNFWLKFFIKAYISFSQFLQKNAKTFSNNIFAKIDSFFELLKNIEIIKINMDID